jgi:dTMP kinase
MAFLSGVTLLGTEVGDEIRGRVFAFIQTSTQVALLLTILLSSVVVGLGGSRRLLGMQVSSTRILLLAAGLYGVAAGVIAFRQMDDKKGVALLPDLVASIRGRPLPVPGGAAAVIATGRLGRFIVFEGGEGAGKSTQVGLLSNWLAGQSREVLVTREPGGTAVGAQIRSLLLAGGALSGASLSPRAEALLYAADRADHVATVVRPALQRGTVVVSDRYVDSSLAYQGAGRTLPVDEVGWLSRWATDGLRPDLVVLLDIDPAIGLQRVGRRGQADRLESEAVSFHTRVRRAFLAQAGQEPDRYLVLDAAQPAERIAEQVAARVAALLPTDQGPPEADAGPAPAHEHPTSEKRMPDDASASAAPGDAAASADLRGTAVAPARPSQPSSAQPAPDRPPGWHNPPPAHRAPADLPA